MERFICIHGHFYQPPRENPWLEAIEIQDSAYPYHDWNERVCAECYAPNSASRILDGENLIVDIVSNYDKISFDFGPTLLSWMEIYSPEVYQAILDADLKSIKKRSGHGNAIAQCYNHTIMPICNTRDKRTQILWGIKDFEYRFRRYPEGMWLPETAVDIETLDILADFGIKFTILAPHQASKVRKIGTDSWEDVSGGQIDPTMAYLCRMPSNRKINIFFYDGQISRAASFEGELLDKGENFVNRLSTGFSDQRQWPQILNIATDGETYGHHHKFGDMALAFALNHIESKGLGKLINYGEYLENFPPTHEIEIMENTSWSCAHGIERWRSNCGCNSGKNTGWNQEWRGPLRDSLDWLRDELAPEYEQKAKDYLKNPWQARDEYIAVMLDRSDQTIEKFFEKHAVKDLMGNEKTIVLKLLEIQRHAMLMYTSCGWFFDELSGLETVQIVHYAGRAIQLSEGLFKKDIESSFLERLSKASSNLADLRDGANIYAKFVKPSMLDFNKVAAHFALSSTITEYGDNSKSYSYRVSKVDYQKMQVEKTKLIMGMISIVSEITRESETASFCVLYPGGHIFNGGVQTSPQHDAYQSTKVEITTAFQKGDLAAVVRLMDAHFGTHSYSLLNLFRDEQRQILNVVISEKMEEFAHAYRIIYENNNVLAVFLQEAALPVPKIFFTTAEFILNFDLKNTFSEGRTDEEKFRNIMREIKRWNITLDIIELEFIIRRALEKIMDELNKNPPDISLLLEVQKTIELIKSMPFSVNLWQAQNIFYKLSKRTYGEFLTEAKSGNEDVSIWVDKFKLIGQSLFFNIGVILPE